MTKKTLAKFTVSNGVATRTIGKRVILVDAHLLDTLKDYTLDVNTIGYVRCTKWVGGERVRVYLHRLVTGCAVDMVVDHIDHNPCNNLLSNLRICTQSENAANNKGRGVRASVYKGVYICPSTQNSVNPYRAYITADKKRTWLGYFSTEEEAAMAYNDAAIKYFGQFASLNAVAGYSVPGSGDALVNNVAELDAALDRCILVEREKAAISLAAERSEDPQPYEDRMRSLVLEASIADAALELALAKL